MPRNNDTTKSGPCARCDDTDRTVPSSGKTANKPLHVGPIRPDSDVTTIVSVAPATILPIRSERVSGDPAATAALRGKNDWPKQTAANATTAAHIGDVGRNERANAQTNHVQRPATSATGHGRAR